MSLTRSVQRYVTRALPLAALLVLPVTQASDLPAMNYDGQRYSNEQLPASVRSSLHQIEQEFNQRRQEVFDGYIVNRYVREQAESKGISFQQMQQQLLNAPMPTDAQVKAFYDTNRARIPGSLQQMRGEITNYLHNQARIDKQNQLLAKIASDKGYAVELPALATLRLPIQLAGFPSKGNPDAKITLVEFADYQCPHCKDAGPVVKKLLDKYGEQVRLVFRDFPINQSGISRQVAEAAVCAEEQDMYWPFHELAFARQSYLKSITPTMLAEELEMDTDKLASCLATGKAQAKVAASQQEARELGVTSTPSFFVNGRPLPHSHDDLFTQLSAVIDEELKLKK